MFVHVKKKLLLLKKTTSFTFKISSLNSNFLQGYFTSTKVSSENLTKKFDILKLGKIYNKVQLKKKNIKLPYYSSC